jgi:hypothetical protein
MTAIDYCTLAEVEAYSGVNFSDGIGPTDAEIATMITNASRLVDTYAGRQLAGTETHIEYFDSTTRMKHLVLGNRPIISVTKVEETKSDGSLTELTEGRNRDGVDEYWLDDADSGIIRFHSAIGIQALQLFKVTYIAGRTEPPMEAKMATIMLVVRQAARAALNDENCETRIKEMWNRLLASSEKEYREMLDRVKRDAYTAVSVFGNGGA